MIPVQPDSQSVAELEGAQMSGADLFSAVFEPKSLPELRGIAAAKNLQDLTYRSNPDALSQLRKLFQDSGFRQQERKITYALRKSGLDRDEKQARDLLLSCGPAFMLSANEIRVRESLRKVCENKYWYTEFTAIWVNSRFSTFFFDWTCKYGMQPSRCVWIILWVWLICSVFYSVLIHSTGRSGLLRIYNPGPERLPGQIQMVEPIRPRPLGSRGIFRTIGKGVLREWSVFRTSMFFSLMSAFNLGFREINFGRWLRMLTREEFDIKAVGWARVVAGVQSLISFYMVVLWVLTYFGRPFE